MADALISPAVGLGMWGVTAGAALYSIKELEDAESRQVPLMGVMGAFVFAAQMINFAIPGVGSSGHLGGGLLLAILLGPHAGFLTMASVLVIQALFFADGGLLALGCNIFNLGVFPCFIAYPLIFRPLVNHQPAPARLFTGALLAAIIGLQLGAFGVTLQTFASGRTELPFGAFLLLMLPVHLAIGLIEGLATAAIAAFAWKASPEIIAHARTGGRLAWPPLVALALAAALTGGVLAWFASAQPDGLEWAIGKVSGKQELEANGATHRTLAAFQQKTALLPDYEFSGQSGEAAKPDWPAANAGTSVAGLVGGAMTLLLAGLAGLTAAYFKKLRKPGNSAN